MEANHPYSCRECGLGLPNVQEYMDHVMWDHDPRRCLQPGIEQPQLIQERASVLAGQQQLVQEQQQQLEKQRRQFEQVQQQFELQQQQWRHEQQLFQLQQQQQQQMVHEQPLQHRCESCGKTFTRSYNLKRHMKVHSIVLQEIVRPPVNPEVNVNCTICNASISEPHIMRHMHRFHSPWTAAYCEDTGRVHDPTQIPGAPQKRKPKECPECGLFFMYDGSFIRHLDEHGYRDIRAVLNVSYFLFNDDDDTTLILFYIF